MKPGGERLWRRVQRPWVTAVLLLLLAGDVWWITPASPLHESSRAGRELHEFFSWVRGHARSTVHRPWYALSGGTGLYLVHEPTNEESSLPPKLRLIDEDRESWDELSELITTEPERIAGIRATFRHRRDGWWALTREHFVDRVRLEPMEPGAFPEVAAADFRPLLAGTTWPGALAGPADQSRTRILWWGYVHNLAAAVVFVGLLVSLGWVQRLPSDFVAWRGRRRWSRGECPGCRYVLAGLEHGRCPECGCVVDEVS